MLAYFLAVIMAIVSFVLFFSAFFSPKTHRQDDFLWSALGLFYALVLWICAGRFTGAILLGQFSGVAITVAFMWENRQLRKVITAESNTNDVLEGFSVLNFIAQSTAKISGKSAKTVMVEEKVEVESVTSEEKPEIGESSPPTVTEVENKTASQEKEIATPTNNEVETTTTSPTVEKPDDQVKTDSQETPTDDDDDFLGASLVSKTSPSTTEKNKSNLWQTLTGFFRKKDRSEPANDDILELKAGNLKQALSEIDDLDDEDNLNVDIEEFSEENIGPISEIDPTVAATEVEKAIDNIEIPENPVSNEGKDLSGEEKNADDNPESVSNLEETELIGDNVSTPEVEIKKVNPSTEEETNTPSEESSSVVVEEEEIPQDDIIESLNDLLTEPDDISTLSESTPNKDSDDSRPE